MTPEGAVKTAIKRLLVAEGVYYFMPVSNGMGVMGVFDFVCCANGVFLGIECKADAKKKPTLLQTRNAKLARAAGAVIFLAHSGNIKDLAYTIYRIKEGGHGADELSFWPFDCPAADA